MTMNSFSDVPIGSSSSEIVKSYGEPFAVHKTRDGNLEYEYLERVKAGSRTLEERRYVFVIKDGKVVSKHIKGSTPAPYYFDSYEMQTTKNESESVN